MAGAVVLMAPVQVQPSPVGPDDLCVGVEVAVILLRRTEDGDALVDVRHEPFTGLTVRVVAAEQAADGFEPLVQVAVHERQVVAIVTGRRAGGELEVVDVPGLDEPVPSVGDADHRVGRPAVPPQSAGDATASAWSEDARGAVGRLHRTAVGEVRANGGVGHGRFLSLMMSLNMSLNMHLNMWAMTI
jgi:hypothetical protein